MDDLVLGLTRNTGRHYFSFWAVRALLSAASFFPFCPFSAAQTLGQDSLGGAGLGSTDLDSIGLDGVSPDGVTPDGVDPDGVGADGTVKIGNDTSEQNAATYLQSEEDLAAERQDSAQAAAAELDLDTSEIVAQKVGGIALGFGNSQPWQLLSLEAIYRPASWPRRTVAIGLTTGGGVFKDATTAGEQSVDLNFTTKSFGLIVERSLLPFEHLTIGFGSGFSTFEGTVDPHGRPQGNVPEADPADEAAASAEGLLQRDISASGVWFSAYIGLHWIFRDRYTVIWRPFGVRITKLLAGAFDEPIQKSAKKQIEAPGLYGVTNLTIGLAF